MFRTITLGTGVKLKPIPISPSYNYRAGSDGKIYSRTQYMGFGKKKSVGWYPLKGYENKAGYVTVSLSHQNKRVTKTIHRLICMAFHGMPDPETLQVRHLDGTRDNNKPENLRWGTQAENWADRRAHGNGLEGEKNPRSKISDEDRDHLRWALQKGLCSHRHAARILGMSQVNASRIARSSPKKKEVGTINANRDTATD